MPLSLLLFFVTLTQVLSLALDAGATACPLSEPLDEKMNAGLALVQLSAGRSAAGLSAPIDTAGASVWDNMARKLLNVPDTLWFGVFGLLFVAHLFIGNACQNREREKPPDPLVAQEVKIQPGSSANIPHASNADNSRSPEDVIEDLGFGWAQIRMLLLSTGIWFLDGWELALVSTLATSTANDLGLGVYGRAMLSSMAMFGLIPGCILGGWMGDLMGRKPPIILSYFTVAAVSLLTALAPGARSLLILRGLMGASVGLGMPPSTVMMSELTPTKWRSAMIAGRGALYATGILFAQVFCLTLDPTLENLNWRLCFLMALPPTLIFLIPTCIWLDESPLFFACIGDHYNANRAFEHMRLLNRCPEVSISYADMSLSSDAIAARTDTGSFWDHLRVIFGSGMFGCSVILIVISVSVALFGSGHGYGLPRVLMEESEKHRMMPGTQLVIDGSWAFFGCLMVFALDCFLSRKRLLLLLFSIFTIALSTFAWFAHTDRHIWIDVVALQMCLGVLRTILNVTVLTVHLASTECYPTALLATGTSLCLGLGRIGSAFAPMIFEWCHVSTGLVTAFYYVCSALALLNAVAILGLLPNDLETARAVSSKHLDTILSQCSQRKPLECKG